MPAELALHSLIACAIRLFSTANESRVVMSRTNSRKASISIPRSGGREGRLHSTSVIIVASNNSGDVHFAAEGKATPDEGSDGFAAGPVLSHPSISFAKATMAVDLPPGRRTGRR